MAARIGRRLVTQTLRPKVQQNPFAKANGRAQILRRNMSAEAPNTSKLKGDIPWIVVSGSVTLGGLVYLLTPAGKKDSQHVAASHAVHAFQEPPAEEADVHPEPPMKDDEGTEASGEDVKASMDQGFKADSPEDAKKEEEHPSSKSEEDSEEDSEKSSDDKTASSKDEKKDDSNPDRFNDGAPGQTSAVHDEDHPEQSEKPTKRRGTIQDEGDKGPTNLGDARKKAAAKSQSPKEAQQESKNE